MGNNAAMTAFEHAVISCYDAGVLTPSLLDALAEPYRGTDIDEGGLCDLRTQDGKGYHQVIVECLMPGVIPAPDPDLCADGLDCGPCWWGEEYEALVRARWEFC